MDCYTLGSAVAAQVSRAGGAIARHASRSAPRRIGYAIHRIRHPLTKTPAVHPAAPGPAVIHRIACQPPPGFFAALAKGAGIAAIGGAVLASPTSLPNAVPTPAAITAPSTATPGQTGPLALATPLAPAAAPSPSPFQPVSDPAPATPDLPPGSFLPPGPQIGDPGTPLPPITSSAPPPPPTPVPEPPGYMTMGVALLATLLLRRRECARIRS
jgi:hypothetical protein